MNRPDEPIEPDHVTETALRLLPIPAHGESFWDDLDRALDAAPAPAPGGIAFTDRTDRTDRLTTPARPGTVSAVDDTLALVPAALRKRSNAMVAAVAAAAIVIVVLAGTSLAREGGGTRPVALTDSGQEGALDSRDGGARPASVTAVTLSARNEAASSAAVAAWVDAVHAGDADAAWDAMGPGSQEHFGNEADFEAELAAMDDQFGGWSVVRADDVLITPVLAEDEGTIAVVTLIGSTQAGGTSERRAEAVPVRIVDGEVVLEPFVDAGPMELAVPTPATGGAAPVVAPDAELVVVVPEGVDAPILRLDDGEAVVCGESDDTELTAMDDLPMQRCSYLPKAGIAPGEHTLTVAFAGPDGSSISADALLLQAA